MSTSADMMISSDRSLDKGILCRQISPVITQNYRQQSVPTNLWDQPVGSLHNPCGNSVVPTKVQNRIQNFSKFSIGTQKVGGPNGHVPTALHKIQFKRISPGYLQQTPFLQVMVRLRLRYIADILPIFVLRLAYEYNTEKTYSELY